MIPAGFTRRYASRRPAVSVALAAVLGATILPLAACGRFGEPEAPTPADLVRPGAQTACANFHEGYRGLVTGDTSEARGYWIGRLELAREGAFQITGSDGAYAELDAQLVRLLAAIEGGDDAERDAAAERITDFCAPILEGEYPEPQPPPTTAD